MEVRPGYKQTEVGQIPEDWEVAPLSALCRISDGTHFTPRYVAQGIPFYSVENVTANDFSNTKFISEAEHAMLVRRCKPERGDILMTRIGSLGDTKLLDWDVNASIYVSLALLKPTERVNSEYLYGYSRSKRFVLGVEKRSLLRATPKKINMGDIGEIPVPFPRSIHEQQAIAEALSDADALIESLEQLLAKKGQLKQGAMQELLTGKKRLQGFESKPGYKQTEIGLLPADWDFVPFSELLEFRNGVNADKAAYGAGVRFINVLEVITKSHLHASDIPGRIALPKRAIDWYLVRRGDVIFNRTSETQEEVGLAAVYDDDEGVVFGGFVIRGRQTADTDLDAQYSGYALRSHYVRRQIIARGQGAIRANVGQNDLRSVRMPRPPRPEQEAIAACLSDMDADLAALEAKLAKARQLKEGMMQELLTGRIRLPVDGQRATA